jgi:hypothetical protein
LPKPGKQTETIFHTGMMKQHWKTASCRGLTLSSVEIVWDEEGNCTHQFRIFCSIAVENLNNGSYSGLICCQFPQILQTTWVVVALFV